MPGGEVTHRYDSVFKVRTGELTFHSYLKIMCRVLLPILPTHIFSNYNIVLKTVLLTISVSYVPGLCGLMFDNACRTRQHCIDYVAYIIREECMQDRGDVLLYTITCMKRIRRLLVYSGMHRHDKWPIT